MALPAVLPAGRFVLRLLAVAVVAGALAVGEVEFVAAFGDVEDVVRFGGEAGAVGAADLAVSVAGEDLVGPGGALCAGDGADARVSCPVHGYPPSMGYKEWRERQDARIDAMNARADARVERAKQREADVRAEVEAAKVKRADDAARAWEQSQAARLGESHEDLVARARAVGLAEAPESERGAERLMNSISRFYAKVPIAVLAMPLEETGTTHGGELDRYRQWRERIILAERLHAKAAEGVPLSKGDRVLAKVAGVPLP